MLSGNVLNDYTEDWVLRCTKSDCIRFDILKRRGIMLFCEDKQIKHTFENIFEKKDVYCTDVPLSGNEEVLCCRFSFCEGTIPHEDVFPHILITDIPEEAEKYRDKCAVLYTGSIFGAGFIHSRTPRENSSSVIHDVFTAALFMASRKGLKNGVYYCGFGGCNIKAKSLISGGFEHMLSYEDSLFMLEYSHKHGDKLFCFDNTYGGKLSLLHETLFLCLNEFDRICRKHGIKYYLGGGTLLGAVRHSGMIPWDDDMDVMMLRDDYRRFISVVESEINSDEFFFQSADTDSEYHSIFTKIRLNGTEFKTRFSSRFGNMHQGIFIDIFVHDKTADIKALQKLHVFLTLFVRSMVFHKWEGTPMHFYGKMKLLCRLTTLFIRHTDIRTLEKIQERTVTFFDKFPTHSLYDGTGEHLRHGAFPAKWLGRPKYLRFGEREYPVPSDYDRYLEYSYGDYMKLIPASLRKAGHDVVSVDFGKYGD